MWQPPIDDYLINVFPVTVLSNLCLLKIAPQNSFVVAHEKHLLDLELGTFSFDQSLLYDLKMGHLKEPLGT